MEQLDAGKIRAEANAFVRSKGHGATQMLADAAGVERMTLYRFLRGKSQPTEATLRGIAEAIGLQAEAPPKASSPQIDYAQVASELDRAGRHLLSVADALRSETATPLAKQMTLVAMAQYLKDALPIEELLRLQGKQ